LRQATVRTRRVVGASIVLCAGVCASSTARSTVEAAQSAERWNNVHYASGQLGAEHPNDPCDFNGRLRLSPFDLLVESNQVAFTLPSIHYSWQSCPSARREITITRVGFSRGSRRATSNVGGGDIVSAAVAEMRNRLQAKSIRRYFLSLDYREPGGDSASATFYLEGRDPASLLTSLSRISKVPVEVTASDAAGLERGVPAAVSADPHRRLLANIPIWESQALALEGRISEVVPDGSTALANDALWDLPTGKIRRRVARSHERGTVLTELLAGDGRWLLSARNSGPVNGKNANLAGEVTIIDTMAAATVTRVGPLPWIDRLLLAPEATLALAFGRTPSAQGGGWESTVSAIAIDRGEIVWRAVVPAGWKVEVGRSDAGRVLAFGNDWIRLWEGATGESLFDSTAFLKQLPAEQPPVAIVDAASLNDRVIVVYRMRAGTQVASIDMSSSRVLNSTQLSGSSAIGFETWWNPDRHILLVVSPGGLSLWDTDTLRLIGDLNQQPGPGGLFADFDASGELLATMRYSAEGLDRHVVITDVRTRRTVGQCLLGDADTMHLSSDGRTVLGYQGNRLRFCRRAD
jgi:hypothetical protein